MNYQVQRSSWSLTITLLFIGCIATLFYVGLSPRKKPISAAIFDLDGVLVRTSKEKGLKELGRLSVLRYVLSGHNPANLHTKAFDILYRLRNENPSTLPTFYPTHNGKPLPSIMNDWMLGAFTNKEILNQVLTFMERLEQEQYFDSNHEKRLLTKVMHIMFNPQTRISITKPLKQGIKLLKAYKDAGYKTYLLTNIDHEAMALLKVVYPEIFQLLDGIVASAEVRHMKPYHGIYSYLLQRFDLQPEQCIFFDNQEENIEGAKKLGINSILFTPKIMRLSHQQLLNKVTRVA
jgi:HAD superfamily hydrolase (TIGR01509 family)